MVKNMERLQSLLKKKKPCLAFLLQVPLCSVLDFTRIPLRPPIKAMVASGPKYHCSVCPVSEIYRFLFTHFYCTKKEGSVYPIMDLRCLNNMPANVTFTWSPSAQLSLPESLMSFWHLLTYRMLTYTSQSQNPHPPISSFSNLWSNPHNSSLAPFHLG